MHSNSKNKIVLEAYVPATYALYNDEKYFTRF